MIKRKGEGFVGAWATVSVCVHLGLSSECVEQAMMGGRSKMWFLYPTCAGPILLEAFMQAIKSGWNSTQTYLA